MPSKARDLQGCAVLIVAVAAGIFLLLRNARPQMTYTIPGPTASATAPDSAWAQVIQTQLINGATAIPTHDIPPSNVAPPTLALASGTPILVEPTQLFMAASPTATRFMPITPTLPGVTAAPSPTGSFRVVANNNPEDGQFSPPPEIVPLSLDPRDHFWFTRPVDSSANSTSIFWYAYGSDGPQQAWRVHHGIDLPNPIGKAVHAAGPGRVVWAADHYAWKEDGLVDEAYSYGNVVVIEHDFGYQGKRLYTLYAHLSVFLVQQNQRVDTGTIVGLSGATGNVSGPHVHFEVRVEKNNYFYTRNPILWMAPYENHGVIAGRVLYRDGSPIEDAVVYLINPRTGRVTDTTTTYVHPHRPNSRTWNVNPDDVWNENFVFGDVPVGTYQVTMTVNGVKLTRGITVNPGTTSFVDLGQAPLTAGAAAQATPTPVG